MICRTRNTLVPGDTRSFVLALAWPSSSAVRRRVRSTPLAYGGRDSLMAEPSLSDIYEAEALTKRLKRSASPESLNLRDSQIVWI
jgi:hypothetical protein